MKQTLTAAGIPTYRYHEVIGSTNDEALAWCDHDAVDYALVIADEQTKGKGRFDRRWVTRPDSSLAFSLILKPTQKEIEKLALFAPLCGLAVHDALKEGLGLDPQIKWPNDVLLERKKCCGILVEAAWTGNHLSGVVLGIGINISAGSFPPSTDQLFSPTCLEEVTRNPVDRFLILQRVLTQIQKWRPLLGTETFFSHWQEHLAFRGEQVMIVQNEKPSIIGIEKGINPDGSLVLILENNTEAAFEVGDVHLRPCAAASNGGKDA